MDSSCLSFATFAMVMNYVNQTAHAYVPSVL